MRKKTVEKINIGEKLLRTSGIVHFNCCHYTGWAHRRLDPHCTREVSRSKQAHTWHFTVFGPTATQSGELTTEVGMFSHWSRSHQFFTIQTICHLWWHQRCGRREALRTGRNRRSGFLRERGTLENLLPWGFNFTFHNLKNKNNLTSEKFYRIIWKLWGASHFPKAFLYRKITLKSPSNF